MRSCALVASSGELLQERHGAAIDATPFVARIGWAPTTRSLADSVGQRTSVRFVFGHWRADRFGLYQNNAKINATHVQSVLAAMHGGSEVVFLSSQNATEAARDANAACPRPVHALMRAAANLRRLRYRCVSDAIGCEGLSGPAHPSGGIRSLAILFERFACQTVSLFGFAGTNLSLPYHYWLDGTKSDGWSAYEWYRFRFAVQNLKRGLPVHQFRREHMLMHHVLGNCSWTVRGDRFRELCKGRRLYAFTIVGSARGSVQHVEVDRPRSLG